MRETAGPGSRTFSILARKWTPMILQILHRGPRRFNGLQHSLPGVAHKVLTEQLRALESCQAVVRVPLAGARQFGYDLTLAGRELIPIVELAARMDAELPLGGRSTALR
jgi:DNA-binding HxlR family transcriptional regulator